MKYDDAQELFHQEIKRAIELLKISQAADERGLDGTSETFKRAAFIIASDICNNDEVIDALYIEDMKNMSKCDE